MLSTFVIISEKVEDDLYFMLTVLAFLCYLSQSQFNLQVRLSEPILCYDTAKALQQN